MRGPAARQAAEPVPARGAAPHGGSDGNAHSAGICGLFEKRLKELNPTRRQITYDVQGAAVASCVISKLLIRLDCERYVCCADLFNFIDHMQDMSALV